MAERKTQLDKWQARYGKDKADEQIIRESEAKRAREENTIEKQGEKVAKKMGMSTEDIFMIIARDSVGTWMKMWNNSMESVIRETIQSELPDMIKQVMQEELASAARGFMKGLMQKQVDEILENEFPQLNEKLEPKNALQQMEMEIHQEIANTGESFGGAFESKLNEMKKDVESDLKSISIEPAEKSEIYYDTDEKIKQTIIEAHQTGIDPTSIKQFKNVKSNYNTAYQRFVRKNPGLKGAWKTYAESVIAELNEGQDKI